MLKIILIINIIIIEINIYFKFLWTEESLSFKNIDKVTINFLKNSYKNISNLLISKYFVNNNNSLFFEDYKNASYFSKQSKLLKKLLERNFEVLIKSDNPDYLIFNVHGCNHLNDRYQKSIKIAFFTENQIPDFNTIDYAIGQSHILFLDRYFKRPYFLGLSINFNNRYFKLIRKKVLNSHKRTKFCAALITNTYWTDYFRLEFIEELNKYKPVDMGGKYKNNVGKVKNKIEFLSSYKFSIAMENTEGNGYLSEKIFHSFISGTIPIYYGDYMVDEYINPKSLILIRGKNDMLRKIEYIKKIDNVNELYKKILREDIFIVNNYYKEKYENERVKFIYHIFDQDKNTAKRIDNYHWK